MTFFFILPNDKSEISESARIQNYSLPLVRSCRLNNKFDLVKYKVGINSPTKICLAPNGVIRNSPLYWRIQWIMWHWSGWSSMGKRHTVPELQHIPWFSPFNLTEFQNKLLSVTPNVIVIIHLWIICQTRKKGLYFSTGLNKLLHVSRII